MEIEHSLRTPDGARIGYCLSRGAPGRGVVVLIHGLASNMTRWSEFVEHTSLGAQWDLLRLDLRGHGHSMYRGRIGRERWCADINAILDHEGYGAAVLIGHSMGAQVAMQFAQDHPRRVKGLVLIDPVFGTALRGSLLTGSRLHWLNWLAIRALWLVNFFGIGRRKFMPRDLRALDEKTRAALASDPDAKIAELYMSPRVDLRYIPLVNYLQDLYDVVRPVPDPARLDMPVLVLQSAGASVSDADTTARCIARFPQGETVVIDADHWLLTEKPREAREAIETWCERFAAGEAR